MEQALRDHAPAKAAGRRATRFTALELAAAEQLLHLSESSCSSGAAFTPRGSGTAASAAYSSSSPRSVNAPPAAAAGGPVVGFGADHEEEEEDEQEVGGRPRMSRRYRSIAEVYDATDPAGARRRKGKAVAGGPREVRRK
ncbi:hypothetical protein D1007_50556 [Hordeum vulgare]|uniref:Uncharacterized protein n=1 Tax=Hordeum vulgare subsp. vulgare TaxID=112509 RepID=A0A8I6YFA2_HORVV|nr:uncharacterized protein LOC123409692 [Hordeum vulgare subsp. vulgare]KAE8776742.1 hypothetical protein D1007_50556 [Hordeum vulgare]KAI4973361.1 hypothetical protein ZWY2020_029069 [Hordeum vulgare]